MRVRERDRGEEVQKDRAETKPKTTYSNDEGAEQEADGRTKTGNMARQLTKLGKQKVQGLK